MKEEIIEKIEKFATRVMQGGENVSVQEVAILPEMLKILQKETTGNIDDQ